MQSAEGSTGAEAAPTRFASGAAATPLGAGAGAPTRDRARAASERHSRRVRLFKWLLPLIGAGVALVIFGMIAVVSFLPNIKVSSALITKDGLTMVEPRLSGRANSKAYDVTAARAVQNLKDPKVVRFVDVEGRIEMAAPNWAKLMAREGVYDANTEKLRLEKGVSIDTTDGYKLRLDHADADLRNGFLSTDGPVALTGPNLAIDAVGAEVMDNGAVLVLRGAVRVTLIPKSANPTAGEVEAAPATTQAIPTQPGKGK